MLLRRFADLGLNGPVAPLEKRDKNTRDVRRRNFVARRDTTRAEKSRKARVAGRAYKPAKNQTINLERGAAVVPLGLND